MAKETTNPVKSAAVPAPEQDAEAQLREFEAKIARHEDILYGVALFFEGLNRLYAGHEAVLDTYRKQCRNVIQIARDTSQRAIGLLQRARQNPEKADLFRDFTFVPCLGYPNPEALAKRADLLVRTYEELFPGRPRGQPFDDQEIMRLMEEASQKLD